MTAINVSLYRPHAAQEAFLRSPARRKVCCAGRRGGKTTGMAILAVEKMLDGRRVLEAAPTSDQTAAFWNDCKLFLQPLIDAGLVAKNETERSLQFTNGGRIRAKTAWDADSLRGDYADFLILDEYSIMSPSAWDEVGAPMLLDNNGDAAFIFTPKRKNHAFQLYQRAVADETGRWAAFHFTSYDNPYLSAAALEEITGDMSADAYQQEILARFLDSEGQVFRNIAACLTAPEAPEVSSHTGHAIVIGCDWGRQNDSTAFAVGCATCRTELARDRFNQIDYHFQAQRLKALAAHWQPESILTELNSIGQPVFEMLQREGLPVVGFTTTASTKPPLIENLALAFERGEWRFQPDPLWAAELEAYERIVSPATGRSSYSAPEGMHDDTVIARALMVWQAMHHMTALVDFA